MRALPKELKELFIVHTKRSQEEAQIAARITELMKLSGYSVYGYSDWDWEETISSTEYSWEEGDEIDIVQHYLGEPPLRRQTSRKEIARDILNQILKSARLLVFLHPRLGKLSPGATEELRSFRRVGEARRRDRIPPLLAIYCKSIEGESAPLALEFEHVLVIPRFSGDIAENEAALAGVSSLLLFAANLLLQQCLTDVLCHATETRVNRELRFSATYLWWPKGLEGEAAKAAKLLEVLSQRVEDRNVLQSPCIVEQTDKLRRTIWSVQPEYRVPYDEMGVDAEEVAHSDLERAAAFYKYVLGWQELRRDAECIRMWKPEWPHRVFIHALQSVETPVPPSRGKKARLVRQKLVDNVAEAARRCALMGIKVARELRPGETTFVIDDPEFGLIEIAQRQPCPD